ncbi:MAG TPA: PIN domain-containing protein [Candidatus Saccharimonadales bacterium]|jgi:predicted nucleic-acid-binding protein
MARIASLDACCILRWLLQDIPEQEQAVHKLLSNPGNYHVADTTLMEVVYVLERIYKQERYFIASCLNLIRSLNQINCNRVLITKVMPVYVENPSVSFADCCAATYAELNNAQPLLTFDKKLANKLPQAELLV